MKAIIFGANGQDGYFLTQSLIAQGIHVIGVSRSQSFLHVDLTNYKEISYLIESIKPYYIFNFAANSTTHHDSLFENHGTISTGSINILEAVKNYSPSTRVFITGSGLQFKNTGNPIHETDPFEAREVYSLSRIHSVFAARYYRMLGLKVYVGYLFHHDSHLRSERHINIRIVKALQRILRGSNEKIEIGDLSAKKEFGYAGDISNAILTLVNQDKVMESVIGTGIAYSIQEWIESCCSLVSLDWKKHVSIKSDYTSVCNILVSNPVTINSLGWFPVYHFEDMVRILMKNS